MGARWPSCVVEAMHVHTPLLLGLLHAVAAAAVAAGLTTLVELANLVNMTSLLANPDLTVTVFAPTNEAFT